MLGPPPLWPCGVAEPLPVGVPPFEYPLSLGVAGAATGLRAAGLFAGGRGGPGLALTAGAPFVAGAGGGGGLAAAGGGGGGGGGPRTSSRYAAGVQPDAD